MTMYSLSNDNCTSTFININPINYPSSQVVFPHKTFPTIDTCFSLFHPPSPLIEPFEDEVDLLFPYLQNLETTQQPYFSNEDFNVPISTQVNMDDDLSKKSDGKCNKKKCYKKDRHSKIVTSKGPRDRRMRLSLEVAPRFFNLQEMLGFDKASKTLEWLMNKSHLAIMELSRNTNSCVTGHPQSLLVENTCVDTNGALVSSTTYECEAISSSSNVVEDLEGLENLKGKKNSSSCNKKFNKKIEKTSRRIRPFSKKTREEARERARKRTLKKKQEKYNNEEVFLF